MNNPDKRSAHEERICQQLDRVEQQIEALQDQPATPLNRLRLIQLQLKAQVLFHSWYTKDPDETIDGLILIDQERRARDLYQMALNKVTGLIDAYDTWKDQRVDLSSIEGWVHQPEALA